ncbi:junctional sarcoplasmic reticulum protein 1 [Elephas maximus indicus]|uniref:junctional sarcoplasmic reticulum protein 1 n=1 Tax=Elephas maximus indicus TaxID=99487 RepID=UPI002115D62F|nr:junctional sarcoplasmic reticulum protein 1 [Elephas maximus indicus]
MKQQPQVTQQQPGVLQWGTLCSSLLLAPPPLLSAVAGADWSTLPPPATCPCLSRGHLPKLYPVHWHGGCGPDAAAPGVAMTTRASEELDGGLGSCQAGEDLSALADPCPGKAGEDKARGTPRPADLSSQPHDSPAADGSVDAKPKKMEKESVVKVAPSPGKEKLKTGATPRSAPARKKAQASPPPQPPPPPPLCEELPWGDLSLNKCLVLVSLVALLGSAFQLCRDAVIGKVDVPAPAPEPWVPPSSAQKPREPLPVSPKRAAAAPALAPPAPQAEAKARPEAPGSREAKEEDKKEASKTTGEAQVDRGPKEKTSGREWRKEERPRKEKEERPRKERQRREKEERPRKERPRREERPRTDRELRGALPRRGEAREEGHRPWARDSGDPEPSKRPTWASKRKGQTSSEEEERPDRQKHRTGKGRD